VSFVGVNDVEATFSKQTSHEPGRLRAAESDGRGVNGDAGRAGSLCERSIGHREQFRVMPSRSKSLEQQQCLALSAAPSAFQIH
jgi:hypothetical protein